MCYGSLIKEIVLFVRPDTMLSEFNDSVCRSLLHDLCNHECIRSLRVICLNAFKLTCKIHLNILYYLHMYNIMIVLDKFILTNSVDVTNLYLTYNKWKTYI